MESRSKTAWVIPATGIAFVVLTVVSFALQGSTPDPNKSGKEVVDFFTDNRSKIMISATLEALGAMFFVFFAANLRRALRAAEGDDGVLSAAVLAGGVIVATGLAADATLIFAIADKVKDLPPVAVQAMNGVYSDWFLPMAMGGAVFMWSVALSVLRHGALPKWLGWLTLVMAVLSVTPVGFFVFLALAIWIPLVGILLYLRERKTAPA